MWKWVLGATLLVLGATPATAEYEVTTKEGWYISQSDSLNSCTAIFPYEGDSILSFSLFWRTDEIIMYFTNKNWISLAEKTDQTAYIKFDMFGDVEYDEWYDRKAVIVGNKDGDFNGFELDFGKEHKIDLLTSWSFATGFSAEVDGKILGNFTLRGSKLAIEHLLKCSGRALKNDRSDPFAQ